MNNVIALSRFQPGLRAQIEVCRLDQASMPYALQFIESWSADDAYDRFGCAGISGPEWLASEIAQNGRRALIAVQARRIVGLLDYVYALGAIHFGIVVDRRFRQLSIGSGLVYGLLEKRRDVTPVSAECRVNNLAAVGLLRRCRFQRVRVEQPDIIWHHV